MVMVMVTAMLIVKVTQNKYAAIPLAETVTVTIMVKVMFL